MTDVLLRVSNVHTQVGAGRVVDRVSFDIRAGETFALLGESGCGKSMTALSIMRLLPQPAGRVVAGQILLDGKDLLQLPEAAMRTIRGKRIAMIFQEPMTSLNPVLTVGQQIGESLYRHQRLRGRAGRARAIDLLASVGIPAPANRIDDYPHQLSGGMKQRVMIAIALAGEPELLIADEPTTALDVTIQAQVLALLRRLQRDTGMSMLLITHDLGVVAGMADQVAVMYAGQIVEHATTAQFFAQPGHPYSKKLFDSLPTMAKRGRRLDVIRGTVPSLTAEFHGCRFERRCDYAWQTCRDVAPQWHAPGGHGVRCHLVDAPLAASQPQQHANVDAAMAAGQAHRTAGEVLSVNRLSVHFPIRTGVFKRVTGHVHAVDGVSMTIHQGRTLALVGESGCGKTTAGKAILQLVRPTAGEVWFEGARLTALRGAPLRQRRKAFQIIFQDPFSSMNPRMTVADIIAEGMIAQGIGDNRHARRSRVDELLHQVGLSPAMRDRYPHEFSGGQRQRICIARALALDPKLIVCDEPTSALDVSVQAQILNLLKDLQNEMALSYLFITHNISVVAYLAHDVAVMYLGRIVERGTVDEVLTTPAHPYTQALLAAVPDLDRRHAHDLPTVEGDIPSPIDPPEGCHFHPRCPHAGQQCRASYPEAARLSDSHIVHCYLLV